jgi:large subunit ribosomal protein L3
MKHSIGIVGRKAGMSRIFTADGVSVPVTLIEATPNRITQIKTVETDGYTAVQVTTGEKRASLVNKPEGGHFAKAKVAPGRGLWEFRVEPKDLAPTRSAARSRPTSSRSARRSTCRA